MNGIELYFPVRGSVVPDTREALRYIGVTSTSPDDKLLSVVEDVNTEIVRAAKYAACYTSVDCVYRDGLIMLGDLPVRSKDLVKNLSNCGAAFIFAATSGAEIDRLISREMVKSSVRGLIADSLGSAAIEAFCDNLNRSLSDNIKTRPRFSPGYGDFNISFQKNLIQMLDARRKIGLSLTDSCMMTPSKSVTAVIGIES